MREKFFKPVSSLSILSLSVAVIFILGACSNTGNIDVIDSKANGNVSSKSTTDKTTETYMHSHASNPCTAAVEHSHVYQDADHEHRYDCENTNKIVINGHVHPATKTHRKYRHVHPNGASEHSHH